MMYLMMDICSDSSLLNTLYLVKVAISLISMLVPILLMLMLMITCVRCMVSNDSDMLTKLRTGTVNKIVACLIVFLVPTFVNLLISNIGGNTTFSTCYANANSAYIKERKQLEAEAKQAEKTQRKQQDEIKQQQLAEKRAEEINNNGAGSGNNGNNGNNGSSSNGGSSGGSSGGSNGDGSYSESLNNKKYVNTITYFNQGDYKSVKICTSKNVAGSGCGHTALSMIANTFGNRKYTVPDVAKNICNNRYAGYREGSLPIGVLTSNDLMNSLGLEVETIIESRQTSKTYNEEFAKRILKAVRSGKAVIIWIPGHYVVVGQNPKCNMNQIYYYDPGNRSNLGCYTMKEFWNKTWNHRDRCTTPSGNASGCGWQGAWAYNGK